LGGGSLDMGPAWLGFWKLVFTVTLSVGAVGGLLYLQGGWVWGGIGALAGGGAAVYGIQRRVRESRRRDG
jgi:hypothetical protein